jgi:hypothetical protein
MTTAIDRREFPNLFSHKKRADWGVGVMSGERDGKRSYLFEDGEERVLGAGGIELMRKVEQPSRDQQATCARLLGLLAKREGRADAAEAAGASAVIKQLEKLHKKFHGGFFSKEWRTDETTMFVRQARLKLVPLVQEQLSAEQLGELVKLRRGAEAWRRVIDLLEGTGFATGSLRAAANDEQHLLLAESTYNLLHGTESYERRFDKFVSAYESVFRDGPSWQTATALPALMSPVDQVFVEPTSFRKQLKALARTSAFGSRPSGASYARCLAMARALANMLASRGEVPRDLLDVHDFIRSTI